MIPRFVDDRLRLLLSYHYARGIDFDTWLPEMFGDKPPELFFDSGAYSADIAAKKGKDIHIDIEEYADWLHKWKRYCMSYATLDVIADWRGTIANTQKLQDLGLNPLPVFTGGSPPELLDDLISEYAYISVGGLVGTYGRGREMMRNLRFIHNRADGEIGIHGFGAVDAEMQRSFRWYSADSTTWLNGHRYGKIRLFDHTRGGITDAKARNPKAWGKHAIALRSIGVDWRNFAYQDTYAPAKEATTKLAIIAYKTLEQYIRDIWGEFPMPDDTDKNPACGIGPGPKIFLAITPASAKTYLSKDRAGGDGTSMSEWLACYAETGDFYATVR